MKRVLALVGLMMIGAMLLVDPSTGVIATTEQALPSSTVQITTTAAPPDPGGTDPATTTTTDPPTTTTTIGDLSTGVYVGDTVSSEFGGFEVQITIEDGMLTSITTLREPDDRKSLRINSRAIPIYTEEALRLQSSDFDVISGATVTWEKWGASLASALKLAGLT